MAPRCERVEGTAGRCLSGGGAGLQPGCSGTPGAVAAWGDAPAPGVLTLGAILCEVGFEQRVIGLDVDFNRFIPILSLEYS